MRDLFSHETLYLNHLTYNLSAEPFVATTTTTFLSISLSDETCSGYDGYEDFRNQVRTGIERGLNNDIDDFSKEPGISYAARKRVDQFKRRFTRIFNVWYVDVTKKGPKKGRRQCLTDNFPYDSPGNPDKDSVIKLGVIGDHSS